MITASVYPQRDSDNSDPPPVHLTAHANGFVRIKMQHPDREIDIEQSTLMKALMMVEPARSGR